jgi:hypothetical protein
MAQLRLQRATPVHEVWFCGLCPDILGGVAVALGSTKQLLLEVHIKWHLSQYHPETLESVRNGGPTPPLVGFAKAHGEYGIASTWVLEC